MYQFRDIGYSVDYFFDFSVTTDLKNSSWRILDIDQPSLGMSREYLVKGLEDADAVTCGCVAGDVDADVVNCGDVDADIVNRS